MPNPFDKKPPKLGGSPAFKRKPKAEKPAPLPQLLKEPTGGVLPCDDPNVRYLGHGAAEDDKGPLCYGWRQKRVGDQWVIRHDYDGKLCPKPHTFKLGDYGDAMRRVLALNREESNKRVEMFMAKGDQPC